jgi:hypothetical protein
MRLPPDNCASPRLVSYSIICTMSSEQCEYEGTIFACCQPFIDVCLKEDTVWADYRFNG